MVYRFGQLVPNGTPELLNKLLCTLDTLGRRDVGKIVTEYSEMQSGARSAGSGMLSSNITDGNPTEAEGSVSSLTGLNIRNRFSTRLRGLKAKLRNNTDSPAILKGGYLERMLQ